MSLPLNAGGRYTYTNGLPYDNVPAPALPENWTIDPGYPMGMGPDYPAAGPSPYDNVPPVLTDVGGIDPGYGMEVGNANPDGADAGPMYVSPAAELWLDQNVYDQGYYVNWGTRQVIDENGHPIGLEVPAKFGPIA